MTSADAPSADLLATIVAATRRSLEVRQAREPIARLERRAEATRAPAGRFVTALRRTDRLNVIAECKRRSPSRGVLRSAYDVVAIARAYEAAGAAAISVLTEPTFFDGSLEHLGAVRAAVGIPLLRKDFVVSEYQVLEARAAGADAILLIVAALSQVELASLLLRSEGLALEALVEVHSDEELDRAIEAGARVIGVNNRNLRTLDVDLRASESLIARMPKHVVAVCESGLRTSADLVHFGSVGYHAFLIGERFMTAADPGVALRGLLDASDGTVVGPPSTAR